MSSPLPSLQFVPTLEPAGTSAQVSGYTVPVIAFMEVEDSSMYWSQMLALASLIKRAKFASRASPFINMNKQLSAVYRAVKHSRKLTGRAAWNYWYTLQSRGYAQLGRKPLESGTAPLR